VHRVIEIAGEQGKVAVDDKASIVQLAERCNNDTWWWWGSGVHGATDAGWQAGGMDARLPPKKEPKFMKSRPVSFSADK
jgi:hypothetical protein